MHVDDAAAHLAPLAIAIPIVGACLLLAVGRLLPRPVLDGTAIAVAAGVLGLDIALFESARGGRVIAWVGGWTPAHGHGVGIVLVVDRIGAGIALLAAALMVAALVYSWRYFDSAQAHYHVLMLLFLAGMTGFALTGDLFDMFVFFELMGAVAYALTGFKVEDRTSLQGALNFGIINSFGAYLTLTGIALLYAHTGQLGLAQIGSALDHSGLDGLVVVAFALVITGWFVKAALVPFHFWLDDAHAAAPTPVCVLFSGVMVELGLYGVLRVYWVTFAGVIPDSDFRRLLIVMGAVTAVLGAVMCLAQRHLKRLLAFSTIAHVGLFVSAAGTLDGAGTTGSAVYIVSHAGAKSALFLLAGYVLNRYNSVDEVTLHGKGRDSKFAAVLFVIAGLALSGLPPFGTGLGKSIGEDALSASGYWFGPILFVAVSAMTGGAVLRAGARIFLGLGPVPAEGGGQTTGDEEESEGEQRFRSLSGTLAAPIIALLAGCLAVGCWPAVSHALGVGAQRFVTRAGYIQQALHFAAPARVAAPEGIDWTTSGVLLGLLATGLALAVAGIGLYSEPIRSSARRLLVPFVAGIGGLRRLHSGHIGDYMAWLVVGAVVLIAMTGLPLR